MILPTVACKPFPFNISSKPDSNTPGCTLNRPQDAIILSGQIVYRVKVVHSGSRTGRPECLTCKDADCQYVSAHFSSSAAFYIKDCLGPDVPTYALHRTTDHVEGISRIRILKFPAER